jgi:hypothetical protein
MVFLGMPCRYGPVKALIDASVQAEGHVSTFRPLIVGVSAVWESIRKGIVAKESSHERHFQCPWLSMVVMCVCLGSQ